MGHSAENQKGLCLKSGAKVGPGIKARSFLQKSLKITSKGSNIFSNDLSAFQKKVQHATWTLILSNQKLLNTWESIMDTRNREKLVKSNNLKMKAVTELDIKTTIITCSRI